MTPADPLFRQRLLRAGGFYMAALDGIWGAKSNAADTAFLLAGIALRKAMGAQDERSEVAIGTLLPPVQKLARTHLATIAMAGLGVRAKVLSGTRTYAEQDALYAQGRGGDKRPRVTKAKAGQSNHHWGVAYDLGLFRGADYLQGDTREEAELYAKVAGFRPPGVSWGGDFRSFPDAAHFEIAIGLTLAETRRRFEAGLPYLPTEGEATRAGLVTGFAAFEGRRRSRLVPSTVPYPVRPQPAPAGYPLRAGLGRV